LFANIRTYATALKEKLSPEKPFGLGLRLSAAESEELLTGDRLKEFKEFLDAKGIYVFTLNAFPYGSFHGEHVKSDVFAPDWRDEKRVRYTLRMIDILEYLLPRGMEGSISTLPLSYKPWVDADDEEGMARITANLVRVVEKLTRIKKEVNTLIHLDMEPEPDGLVERSEEAAWFFDAWLLPLGCSILSQSTGMPESQARKQLLEHVRICLDACHMAVEYEDPVSALDTYARSGIQVGKVQITSGLKILLPHEKWQRKILHEQLQLFTRSPYLHQVIAQGHAGERRQFKDLTDALAFIDDSKDKSWRIHYHVPLFVDGYEMISSTHSETRVLLQLLRERSFCSHLEIETYTWELLPDGMKEGLLDTLQKEYFWVLNALGFGEDHQNNG
jgi:sugar phosphate isomerase/epimerase